MPAQTAESASGESVSAASDTSAEIYFIDTHCHLDAAEYEADRDAVARAAREVNVRQIVVPAIGRENFEAVAALAQRYPGCSFALGIHPLYVDRAHEDDLDAMDEALSRGGAVAVGEIGLDFFVPDYDEKRQVWFYVQQLKLARKHGLPVLMHVRRSQDTILKFLRRIEVPGGIAHAFNGSRQQADAFIATGCKLGFGGVMTYARATRLRDFAANLPFESIVLETDGPDIPPEFASRARNDPANLPRIAQTLAELRGVPLDEVARQTSANARAVLPRLGAPDPRCG